MTDQPGCVGEGLLACRANIYQERLEQWLNRWTFTLTASSRLIGVLNGCEMCKGGGEIYEAEEDNDSNERALPSGS